MILYFNALPASKHIQLRDFLSWIFFFFLNVLNNIQSSHPVALCMYTNLQHLEKSSGKEFHWFNYHCVKNLPYFYPCFYLLILMPARYCTAEGEQWIPIHPLPTPCHVFLHHTLQPLREPGSSSCLKHWFTYSFPTEGNIFKNAYWSIQMTRSLFTEF